MEMLRRNRPRLDKNLSSSRAAVRLFLDDLRQDPEHLRLAWNLPEMAETCGLGPTQFAHIVKQLSNLTPHQHLIGLRLDRAATLLESGPSMSITDLAYECGFSSSQYFATAFRKRFGHVPRAHRSSTADLI
jgi:AraC family L-rhamnose operon regulatory protein RhaS